MSFNPHVHAKWDRIAAMNKARAKWTGGQTYSRKAKRPAPSPAKDSHERAIIVNGIAWRLAADLAMEDFRRAVYPERYEGFSEGFAL